MKKKVGKENIQNYWNDKAKKNCPTDLAKE